MLNKTIVSIKEIITETINGEGEKEDLRNKEPTEKGTHTQMCLIAKLQNYSCATLSSSFSPVRFST